MALLEASPFDASTALDLVKTVFTFIMDIIKGEPILAGAFVAAILVPIGFVVIRKVKNTTR